ncbi:hypothetical protein [Mesorhizobium delmotii]|nr:hypothetical protein [Mesorhizobium delmotii]
MVNPLPILLARGERATDGRFEDVDTGPRWFVFEEAEDVVFWQPRTGQLATSMGRAFALGEDAIYNPGTFAFDNHLNIFADPLEWLRARRDGCIVLDWTRAFDRLRDCPRISVAEEVLLQYRRHMKPPHMPDVYVLASRRVAA